MKLMLTPTRGVPSEVTTCPRMTQAWLHGREEDQRRYKPSTSAAYVSRLPTSCMQNGWIGDRRNKYTAGRDAIKMKYCTQQKQTAITEPTAPSRMSLRIFPPRMAG